MHLPTTEIPHAFKAGDATIQSITFGDIAVNLVRVPKGTDFGPLLQGLPDDLCQCPHWGYVLSGCILIRLADGSQEKTGAGEVFYWPPGHTGRVEEDTSFLEFSPAHAMADFLAHIQAKTAPAR